MISKTRASKVQAAANGEGAEVAPPRHGPGRGSQVSPAERLHIQYAYLTEHGATITSLASQFGRTRETIAACLNGEDFDRFKARVQSEVTEEALTVLRRNAVKAAEKWAGEALDTAASKGDHKAARDLLIAAKVIDKHDDAPHVVVSFGTKVTGHPVGDHDEPVILRPTDDQSD